MRNSQPSRRGRACNARRKERQTLVEIRLVEVVGSRNVHVVQAGDLERERVASSSQRDAVEQEVVEGRGVRRLATHVPMTPEVLKQFDLPQSALGEDLLAEDIGDLLDGDALVGLAVYGSAEQGACGCQYRPLVDASAQL